MEIYRPRGTLARAIYDKFHNDKWLDEFDTTLWYNLNEELPYVFQRKFLPLLRPDESTIQWLEQAKLLSLNIWLHLWHAFARPFLKLFMTQTDINGYLKRGSMFILSEQQFAKLLRAANFNTNKETVNILDVGAGDGEISIRLLNSVKSLLQCAKVNVYATETSWAMRQRLKKRDFEVVENIKSVQQVELISCLNVLDRCIDPFEILQDMYNALAPSGHIILALVLPYMHYVEINSSHLPIRPLMSHWPEKSKQFSFEAEAKMFFELLENIGFKIDAWTKAPYLCEGDLHQSFYWLIDLVVVISKKNSL
ncbi:methyltransferase-like protein 9 isoform X2 [Teleopsis dalmanni]|nr:methyltransferase-like protein 9 isoform X2 [Teleopsis dalmanni]XP_037945395.1 methyltransferase-like protein 9 isoform X2 [Teleopsis dalmanni]XP_037945396.1 methyltransferase-like protein 9 isoform X2 [Teleopsis dalmanni]XP_037945397.1 methyltransferase-like protein 9 isoform X2 [Teleopsis dalmanni]XP_037945398.1 methyltransferase-like protein 9 isoform X2 [Teleopsis dalmanni]XP_037945399.1 methyltransferase-like protein 9 isoform X2 [Teleopsis dalmanni]